MTPQLESKEEIARASAAESARAQARALEADVRELAAWLNVARAWLPDTPKGRKLAGKIAEKLSQHGPEYLRREAQWPF